jgi:hypothetical protein
MITNEETILQIMSFFDFGHSVRQSQCWILNSVTLFAIFLEFVILFDMC